MSTSKSSTGGKNHRRHHNVREKNKTVGCAHPFWGLYTESVFFFTCHTREENRFSLLMVILTEFWVWTLPHFCLSCRDYFIISSNLELSSFSLISVDFQLNAVRKYTDRIQRKPVSVPWPYTIDAFFFFSFVWLTLTVLLFQVQSLTSRPKSCEMSGLK